MTLEALEFLRRFVQHILPHGFTKIRHYGLLANRFRQVRLAICRRVLLSAALAEGLATRLSDDARIEPPRERCCEQCGSKRLQSVPLPRGTINSS